MSRDLPELPDHAFDKADTSDDALFYRPARLVTHIDEVATAALTRFYADVPRDSALASPPWLRGGQLLEPLLSDEGGRGLAGA